jgi:hypothetical protein
MTDWAVKDLFHDVGSWGREENYTARFPSPKMYLAESLTGSGQAQPELVVNFILF